MLPNVIKSVTIPVMRSQIGSWGGQEIFIPLWKVPPTAAIPRRLMWGETRPAPRSRKASLPP
jgi:hypothetical protein